MNPGTKFSHPKESLALKQRMLIDGPLILSVTQEQNQFY